MKQLILIVALVLGISANAQDEKTVTLFVSGQGKTLEEAKQTALRSAIEQAFGTFISSKTEIFNDQLIVDQIVSVANGNIQSFLILNESQLPDGSWGVTLKANVSVDKLTSFVEAKGVAVEIKGGIFALIIKQQLLNEQGEIKAINEMVGLLHQTLQISFDYVIKSKEPQSIDAESKNWKIPLEVNVIANKNIDFCANYCIKTLTALSLSAEEIANYESLNKKAHFYRIRYQGVDRIFWLRKEASVDALNIIIYQYQFYLSLFKVKSGIDEFNGIGEIEISKTNSDGLSGINFSTSEENIATFKWNDNRTLEQIEQMTGYIIQPRGIVSQFKNGGFVVYQKNGHGLVISLYSIDDETNNWSSAKDACDKLVFNGYNDWYLPSINELNLVYLNLIAEGIQLFNYRRSAKVWSSTRELAYGGKTKIMSLKSIDFTRNKYGKINELNGKVFEISNDTSSLGYTCFPVRIF